MGERVRRAVRAAAAAGLLLLAAGCAKSSGPGPNEAPPPGTAASDSLFKPGFPKEGTMSFTITSPAFAEGAAIPTIHTCDGADHSPALRWSGAPEGARGFALVVHDPDAPSGDFVHWALYDLPGNLQELPEEASGIGVAGSNDFGKSGYGGPCPPRGHGRHRYVFTLSALDQEKSGLGPGARRGDLERAMQGHVLGEARLTGGYERR